jgi:hypothetical protein
MTPGNLGKEACACEHGPCAACLGLALVKLDLWWKVKCSSKSILVNVRRLFWSPGVYVMLDRAGRRDLRRGGYGDGVVATWA